MMGETGSLEPNVGRSVVVTGATSGVGEALAAILARRGWTVFAGGRTEAKAEHAVDALRRQVPGGRFEPIWADLARPDEVRRMAQDVLDRAGRLDALVNNAALTRFERSVTPEGHELHFAANCLGPFILTEALAPALAATGGGRIVNVASELYEQVVELEPEDLPRSRDVAPMRIYAQTKVGLIWLTRAFAQRLAAEGVTVNAAHPGFVASGMTRDAAGWWRALFALTRPFQKAPGKGAETPLYLVDADAVAGRTGEFYSKRHIRPLTQLGADSIRAERFYQVCRTLAAAA